MKQSKRIWLLAPALLLLFFESAGQQPVFSHLDVSDRLSQNSVLAITQDNRGFMWFGTRQGLNRFDSRKVVVYKNIPGDAGSLSNNYILSLLTDKRGRLWIGTLNGLNHYQPSSDNFNTVAFAPGAKTTTRDREISCLFEDSRGRIWAGTRNTLYLLNESSQLIPFNELTGHRFRFVNINCIYEENGTLWVGSDQGLARIREEGNQFSIQEIYNQDAGATKLVDNQVKTIAKDRNGQLWIGTAHRGIHLYDPVTNGFKKYVSPNQPASDHIRKLLVDRQGKLWIGTQEGLSMMDPVTRNINTYINDPWNPGSISQNSVHSIYMDKTGSLWIGTFFGGVNSLASYHTPFTVYSTRSVPKLNNNVVSSIVRDNNNDLWIGTEGGGINRINKNGTVSYYTHNNNDPKSPGSNLVKVIYKDRQGNIWAGTHGGGLNRFDPSTNGFIRYFYNAADPYLQGVEITNILEDSEGRLWTGTETQGLQLYQKNQRQLTPVALPEALQPLQRQSVLSLLTTSDNHTWIGTRKGFYITGNNGRQLVKADSTLSGVNCIYEDSHNHIWTGTSEQGLISFDMQGNKQKIVTVAEGLPDNNVLGILEGDNGELWISTIKGLARYNPSTGMCNVYTTEDGIAGNVFNNNAWYKDPAGTIYFGGYHGLTSFIPSAIHQNNTPPPLVFSSLSLHNKEVKPGELLDKQIGFTKELVLSHNQNAFTIEFAALNFIKASKNKYAYQLKGLDEAFIYSNEPVASYTNVPPGHYTLIVKGSNNDGIWSEPIEMQLIIRPPFWKTWWAYTLYVLAALSLVFLVARYLLLRALMKRNNLLTQLKLNFFTNISHEIRTHLSLITGPTEKLIMKADAGSQEKKLLQTIRTNAESLLQLVNELMEFRKAETGNLVLHASPDNIVSFVEGIYKSFSEMAAGRDIEQRFEGNGQPVELFFDREQLEKVFFNLFSNAFKFTPDQGFVSLHITEDNTSVSITVANSGKGIAKENIDKIFENYFQENDHGHQNTGYGIGLALSKSIVQAHKGTITASSEKINEQGLYKTSFKVVLQKGVQHLPAEPLQPANTKPVITVIPSASAPAENNSATLPSGSKPLVLLVDDNKAIRTFIRETLEQYYQIAEAANGADGLAYAFEHIPDLVISDVMMPEMDGLTFCSNLKSDIRTSHIPVILLTAKTAVEHQISGLETGADSYLTKPFSTRILELQVQNLLLAKEKYWQQFAAGLNKEEKTEKAAPASTLHPLDQAFLQNAETIVYENMEDPAFGVAMLAQKALMSQPVFYKKIKAITGLSANDFVKSLRLKRAATLLLEQQYTVYEIAYMVGYENSKYFSREFKKQYGQTPSEYAGNGSISTPPSHS
ncbi:MAG: response regulator [Terrimonas ferruginea]|uniref:hybrid sensor histidine kinase/response regulator transcription factor n=1 Tax=Terrimonas ferruginea TaxID=249 RepID=UPI00092587B9|nr:hybrid sensor histidine kinase/response regulator transcription factor [Terrimonas ferruginea]MBN8783242.1 response regulator [Terrimonas ferruginea]OJW39859.1 MAG: hypothetical protein BGO56_03070 [Sphingobacteriales bacterium 48-107]